MRNIPDATLGSPNVVTLRKCCSTPSLPDALSVRVCSPAAGLSRRPPPPKASIFGKTVQVVDQGKDRSGRWIARVYVDGVDINRELVAQGAAWHYAAASSDPSLAPLQEQARSRRLGLWAQPDPLPPWEWRQQQ